jgi:voltage-gated potassium channel
LTRLRSAEIYFLFENADPSAVGTQSGAIVERIGQFCYAPILPRGSLINFAGALHIESFVEWLRGVTAKGGQGFGPVRSAVLVVKSTIAIIILHGLVILLWASFYRLQCFPSWELSFYFSSSSYATVGYGDVTLPSRWRLLGPLESMAGVLMCGVSVCLLFATITRLVDRDPRHSRKLGYENDPVELKENRHASEQNYA